jgi:single-strand selective monofunctional uracil DNA glycosylase
MLVAATRDLSAAVDAMSFAAPITHVYNPRSYAWAPHEVYLRRYGARRGRVLLLGMNPGPFGMAQTGVPFGDVTMVRDFLGIAAAVGKPRLEHPKRPIQGFECARSEISGTRLWGWIRDRFGTPDAFFRDFFVVNYCPLVFMEKTGRNRTPDKLPANERLPLLAACDDALRQIVHTLEPKAIIGIGGFAERRAREALPEFEDTISRMLHPSPASPLANREWAARADEAISLAATTRG